MCRLPNIEGVPLVDGNCARGENLKRLLIVQQYIPEYRRGLFIALGEQLARVNIDMRLVASQPLPPLAARGDSVTRGLVDYEIPSRSLRVGKRRIVRKPLGATLRAFRPEAVVIEQALMNTEAYSLLLGQSFGRAPQVALWGQGRNYSTSSSRLAEQVKIRVTRLSRWFFAYTKSGADYLIQNGYDARRITITNNTIDTASLRTQLDSVSDHDVKRLLEEYGLVQGYTGLFIGGLDHSKGLDFLFESALRVQRRIPDFKLMVGGEGSESEFVKQRILEGYPVVYLGRLSGHRKAVALQAATLLTIPQWVGLVAVDSLVAGKLIVTTRHNSHSPEFDYLQPNHNAVLTHHDTESFAQGVASLIMDPVQRQRLENHARIDSLSLSIEQMVENFVGGIQDWLCGRSLTCSTGD